MTIIAKRSVQLKGHIYSKGEPAEWSGPIDSRIAANFMTKDGKDLVVSTGNGEPGTGNGEKGEKGTPGDIGQPANEQGAEKPAGEKGGDKNITLERIDNLLKKLGRKGIEQKLDELGVGYRPKMNDSQLALLLLQQQGEV